MRHFKSIKDYCKIINIPAPKYDDIDIRTFEENMHSVVHEMPPFRHEFYAIAIKAEGGGKAISGHHIDFPKGSTVFFNSPFQILSWDIIPNWQGYYVMFTQDFVARSKVFNHLLEDFPFLKIDQAIPFEVEESDLATLLNIFESIRKEYHSDHEDKFHFIETYILLLLNHVKRYFNRQVDESEAEKKLRKADLKILSRFQALIASGFRSENQLNASKNLHSPSFYAEQLNIHTNHLNAVVKSISGQTSLNHIHNHMLQLAKSYLVQTELSIKEIAYALYFDSPNNFSSFFKKHTSQTPGSYRKNSIL